MINETLVAGVVNLGPGQAIWERVVDLLFAPIRYPEIVWILFPMITGIILMEIYFGRYKEEKLGWNTAVGNAMVLVFVAMDLFKKIYGIDSNPFDVIKTLWHIVYNNVAVSDQIFFTTLMTIIVLLSGLLLLLFDFFHILPEKLAFMISSSLPINLFAYVSIVVVYSTMDGALYLFNWKTLVASLILFVVLWIFFGLIHLVEPKKRLGLEGKF